MRRVFSAVNFVIFRYGDTDCFYRGGGEALTLQNEEGEAVTP